MLRILLLSANAILIYCNQIHYNDYDDHKINFIIDIFKSNLDNNGWTNFIAIGSVPDTFYVKAHTLPFTFINADEQAQYDVDEVMLYRPSKLIIYCIDFEDFEAKFNVLRSIPYWHPHAYSVVYIHQKIITEQIAKIFFLLFYHQCYNTVMIHFDDAEEIITVTSYSPYVGNNQQMSYTLGCMTRKNLPTPVVNLKDDIVCTESCKNMTIANLRHNNLATCIGLQTILLKYGNKSLQKIDLFEDKGNNLHGHSLRAYTIEGLPFLGKKKHDNGSVTLFARDGVIWNTIAELMNFTIDLSPNNNISAESFDFEVSVKQIFDFAQRRVDLILTPVYQFDFVIVRVDMTVAFKESGVCIMALRAGFDTTLFDPNLIRKHMNMFTNFLMCFFGSWFVFFLFNYVEKHRFSLDQLGKDLVNTIRNILSLSLYKPPKHSTFRIFLFVSIWSFFVLNFITQASIISFFSAHKRGKDVDTFEDILEKGYMIEALGSPDVMLPESEEKYVKIQSKFVPITDQFGCVNKMGNDSRRFCLIDCSIGHYFARNKLNNKGEPYLHIAKEQMHNYYLNLILHKNSALTKVLNKHMQRFVEAGLIDKWEQYRYKHIKNEVPIKSLSLEDLEGIFKCYGMLVGFTIFTFIAETTVYFSLKLIKVTL